MSPPLASLLTLDSLGLVRCSCMMDVVCAGLRQAKLHTVWVHMENPITTEHVLDETGALGSIISDRDSLFTREFWQEFCGSLQIKHKLSMAVHPQTDGQTVRWNNRN